ncbi:MAG TPA: FadR/GntR family transcriptional regulator [Acetobacteraceae bacterium]|jgi:DNA-binding FadR family transcriptional regulator|nr:FadR/GntR family transcriptional regulator [Acetobacteraceae bacterium]
MNLPPIRARSLVDRVVQAIGQEIVGGRFAPNEALPNEAEWCERLRVSRSVVREALRVLVSKNLITIRTRAGGRVREMSAWNQLDPDILAWRGRGGDQRIFAKELFELRRVVEPAAASLAATRITPEQLGELRQAYEEMVAAGEDTEQFFAPDVRFHRIIATAVGNSLFRSLADMVTAALDITLRMALDAPRGQQQSLPLHKSVMEAIARQDATAAAAAMLRLVDDSERDVAEALSARAAKQAARTHQPARTVKKPARKAS